MWGAHVYAKDKAIVNILTLMLGKQGVKYVK